MKTCCHARESGNPFFKFMLRLATVIGVGMVSTLSYADPLPSDCGYFVDAVSTRDSCPSASTITLHNSAQIIQNPDSALATCNVVNNDGGNEASSCGSGDCSAAPGNSKPLTIEYDKPPTAASKVSVNATPSNGNTDFTVNGNKTLTADKYKGITFDYNGVGKTATFEQTANNKQTLTVNTISSAWNVLFKDNEDIKIGSIQGAAYTPPMSLKNSGISSNIEIKSLKYASQSSVNLKASTAIKIETFEMTDHATVNLESNTIQINDFTVTGSSNINLTASTSIEMKTLSVARGASAITIRTPMLRLDSLYVTDAYDGLANITIYADTIDIGTLDMGQGASVTILPYTSGGQVTFKSNNITASSSSELVLASGDYYMDSFNVPGTSNASSVRAKDSDQIVNFYINGDFLPGNNPGINSAGNNGNFGALPPTNFRLFINGGLNTGGGGTTLNAIIYVEKNVVLGNPTYVKGAISAQNNVDIGTGSQIYYDNNIASHTYASCPNPPPPPATVSTMDIIEATSYATAGNYANANKAIFTKVVNKPFNLEAVHLNSSGNEAPYDGTTTGNKTMDMLVTLYTSDPETCTQDNQRIWTGLLAHNTSHITATIDGTSNTTTQSYLLTNASKNQKIRAEFIDYATLLLATSAEQSCLTSSLTSSLCLVPACFNDGSKILQTFPNANQALLSKCINGDGTTGAKAPCDSSAYNGNCGGKKATISPEKYNNNLGCAQCIADAANMNSCATDNFAIRPSSFKAFGQNQFKRAGEDFNLTIKALDEAQAAKVSGLANNVIGVADYNESLSSLNITSVPLNETNTSISTSCPHTGNFTLNNSSNNFENGEVNATMNFSETGIIDISVSEKPGSEFALIDQGDTPGDQRYITPSSIVYNLDDISQNALSAFIPYTIETSASVTSSGNKDWLYMYNPNATWADLKNMSAKLNYRITAKNKQGATTQNFTKTCFFNTSAPIVDGLKKNTTFDMFLDLKLKGSNTQNEKLSFYVEDSQINSAIWMQNPMADINNTILSHRHFVYPANFLDGESNTTVYFNIDRNISKSVNPVKITFIDANTSTSWMSNPGATNNFVGTTFANISKNFLYSRTHAPRYRFTGNSGDAKIYYETYCDKDGNKTLLPSGSIGSSDSVGWYLNTSHNTSTDGSITDITEKSALHVSDTPLSNSSGISTTNLTYDAANGYPYKTTMQVTPSSWLIYNPYNANALTNDFEVEFYGSGNNWTGINGAKDTSGASTTQTTTDSDAATVTNKRILW